MHWKFWEKTPREGGARQTKPKDLPMGLGKYLVVNMKYDPDWVWSLKIVTIPKKNKKKEFYFRIFSPTAALTGGININHYHSLDAHPEEILFDGWYNSDSWEMEIRPRQQQQAEGEALQTG